MGLILLLAALAAAAAWGQDFCDAELLTDSGHPHAYRNQPGARADRCEGIYIEEVALDRTIRLASLAAHLTDFHPEETGVLELRWPRAADRPVVIRAQGYGRLYYRMDTRVDPGRPFRWSTSTLAALGVRGRDLGLLAWTTMNVGGRDQRVHLPLTVGAGPATREAGRYQLDIEPGWELQEVYLSVLRADGEGNPVELLKDQEELGYGYYPAGSATTIPLEIPGPAGLFRIEITASLTGGGRAAMEFWLYHEDG